MSFETSTTPMALSEVGEICSSPLAVFDECPHCGTGLAPEHARIRCGRCGWRDSSSD
jgi:hypothetical protein